MTFKGTSQQQTIGPPQDQLNTSSFQITNGNAFTVAIQFASSAIGFTGPVSAIDSSGSATFTNAIGATYGMMFFADAANAQGANTPTDLPGTQLTSSAFTVANAADSTSFSQADPFSASGLYSMSLSTTVSLTADAR